MEQEARQRKRVQIEQETKRKIAKTKCFKQNAWMSLNKLGPISTTRSVSLRLKGTKETKRAKS